MSRIILLLVAICIVRSNAGAVDYDSEIKPLFEEKCGACHGVLKQEAGLRLDAGSLVRQGSDDGSVLDFEHPRHSRLVERITTTDPVERMPPEGQGTPLSELQINKLIEWIESGAESPADEPIIASPQEHWAYQRPVKLPLPQVSATADSTNPIDAWMDAKRHEAGLVPTPQASIDTLLRRIYLDVTGLPPSLSQQDEFFERSSPNRWSELINELLDDSAYGEKWGRHWMDVWRYSDWDGYKNEVRGSQPHIWHWRDWIVESLNADKGYDAMVAEMLAGDEMALQDINTLRATGFLVRNFHKSNRDIWLDATVEHSAKAFLGMTIACARCHDHKYDPISQQEYYNLRAVFEPHRVRTEQLPGQSDTSKHGLPRAYDADLDIETFLYVRGNEKNPDKAHPLEPNVPAIIGTAFQVDAIELPTVASHPFMRDHVEAEELKLIREELKKAQDAIASQAEEQSTPIARQTLATAKAKLKSAELRWAATKAKLDSESTSASLALQAAEAERSLQFQQTLLSVLKQRSAVAAAKESKEADEKKKKQAIDAAEKKLTELEKRLVEASVKLTESGSKFTPVGKSYPTTSTGRRTALAKWITHPDNPLTARVAINHLWMRHFGEPLVENVFDFGLRSNRPVHHELLDWLAVEFMENQWSMKHIHRLILNSRTYQLASSPEQLDDVVLQRNQSVDPDNQYFWRANVRRLEAEVVRDSLLAVSGSLDRTMGGADIDYQDGEKNNRRSLYFRHAYEKQMQMLVTFDAANPTDCYRRTKSIIPQQALALANSPLATDQARLLAQRISAQASDDNSFTNLAFRTTLGRRASDSELSTCNSFLQQQTNLLANQSSLAPLGVAVTTVQPATDAASRARENLIHVLMNHNDFVTLR